MRILGFIVRIYSFAFHILLTLFMLAVSSLAWAGGHNNLEIGVLPWKEAALTHWMFFSGLAGLVVTLLAIKRIIPVLFVIWSLAVLVMLVRGFFFSSYNFGPGGGSFTTAVNWVLAALVAAIGSWSQFRYNPEAFRRKSALA